MNWTTETEKTNSGKELSRSIAEGKIAGNIISDSAIEISARYHYNGSGPKHFGGASSWPVAKLTYSFCVGEEKLRDAFIEELKTLVEKFEVFRIHPLTKAQS